MPSDLPTGRKLLVVSDTSMYDSDNGIAGFEPVVRELDSISHLFDEIIWLGYKQKDSKSAMSFPKAKNINLIPMPASGGGGWMGLLKILMYYPVYLFYMLRFLPGVTHLHSRAPSHPALIAMWLSKKMNSVVCWHKYAGNWNEPHPPKSYAFQRQYLRSIRKKNVFGTINGSWPNQEKHLLSFENPCLFEAERIAANEMAKSKSFDGKLILLFVGNLSAFKGVKQLVQAMSSLQNKDRFEHLYIVGDGILREELEQMAKQTEGIQISVLGALNREELSSLYMKAHLNILPSASEGFPKVIAEGAAYGCIPLVTDVSSIGQYILEGQNGFLLQDNNPNLIASKLDNIADRSDLKGISNRAIEMTSLFTFEYFARRIQSHFVFAV